MINLNIYFNNNCENNCQNCIFQESNNSLIKQALQDNTFVTNVRHALTKDTTVINILGKNSNENGEYFSKFITNILDYSPYIQQIRVPVNGIIKNFYYNFIAPLYCYCNSHKRHINLILQFNIDGPPELHNNHNGNDNIQNHLDLINYIYTMFDFQNKYLQLQLTTKSTFYNTDLHNYSPLKWYNYMNNLFLKYNNISPECYNYNNCRKYIVFDSTINYSTEDGKALTKWKPYINLYSNEYKFCTINNFNASIDYQGNLYNCNLLPNKNISMEQIYTQFNNTLNTLIISGEALEQNRNNLFNAILSIYCHESINNQLNSYIRLLGNGFLL